jgi:hypothetical protein
MFGDTAVMGARAAAVGVLAVGVAAVLADRRRSRRWCLSRRIS